MLDEIQQALFADARDRREANITRGVDSMAAMKAFFASNGRYPGWVEVQWSKPTGAALEKVIEELKALKLTVRNVPIGAVAADGACLFTREPAIERVLVGKAY